MNIDLMYPALPSFDELSHIAATNPNALDEIRRHYCESFIDLVSVSRQHQLNCIQNKIELMLQKSSHPLDNVMAISNMMHESASQLPHGLHPEHQNEQTPRRSAEIIPFDPNTPELG